jgi:Uma2 family endonuclease
MTAEQFFGHNPGERSELVDGEVITLTPPGFQHGCIAARIAAMVDRHVDANRLGSVCGEAGFVVSRNPDTVLAPDVAFVRTERDDREETRYFPGAPDLVVEVLSPDDRTSEVAEKAARWLRAGARLVWIVDPDRRSVTVKRPGAADAIVHEGDTILGFDVVPGFACDVARFFA